MSQLLSTPSTRLSMVVAIALLMAACGKGQQQAAAPAVADKAAAAAPAPVATIDGTPIPRAEYDIYLKSLLQGRPTTELTAEQRNQVLDQMISMHLLAAEATKAGLEKDPDIAARLNVLRTRVLADAESERFLKGKEPTDAELHAEYDTAVAAMDKTEYHARHILVASKENWLKLPSKRSRAAPNLKT